MSKNEKMGRINDSEFQLPTKEECVKKKQVRIFKRIGRYVSNMDFIDYILLLQLVIVVIALFRYTSKNPLTDIFVNEKVSGETNEILNDKEYNTFEYIDKETGTHYLIIKMDE